MATKAFASNIFADDVSNQWNWVNISHPRDLNDAANITTIRRRAMLAVHYNKRRNRAKQTPHQQKNQTAVTPEGPSSVVQENAEHINQEGLAYSSRTRSETPPGIDVRLCSAAHLEYPDQLYLLNHWTSVMAPLLLPICTNNNPMSSIWVYNAFGDPLLMSALLSHAAVHLDVVNQRPLSTLTLHYGMEATRQMNSRLDSGDLCLQDTSIAAVVMMLANQIVTSNLVEMQIHLNALERMVQMRGGLDSLGMDGVLQMSIEWVDIPAAMFRNTKPRFTHSASPPRLVDLMNRYVDFSCFDIDKFARMDFTTSLFYLRQEIKNLAEIQSGLMACPSRTSTAEAMEFAARRTSIEHVLLLAGQGYSTMYNGNQDARLREVCCIAGSIYVNHVFRGSRSTVSITSKTLKRRLMTSVERLELEDHDRSDTVLSSIAALLWALCVGGTIAEDLEERTWFVLRLSTMARRIGLKSWEQALSILNCFLWEEKLENEVWKQVWTDMERSIVTGEVEKQ